MSSKYHEKLLSLQQSMMHTFEDPRLLKEALLHPSLDVEKNRGKSAFERLEFLGDRALGLVIAEWLMEDHPDESEGALAKRHSHLVQRSTLIHIARDINLGHVMLFHEEKERQQKHQETILSDGCEALLGALFLDGGLAPVRAFVRKFWAPYASQRLPPPIDPKSELQEWSQHLEKGLPVYKIVSISGPSHQPEFNIEVSLPHFPSFTAHGTSKRDGEKKAALKMLNHIKQLLKNKRGDKA